MKKTKYFVSSYDYQYNQIEDATEDAVEKKEDFLNENIDKIARIENENIIYTSINNSYVTATIVLSYYEKE